MYLFLILTQAALAGWKADHTGELIKHLQPDRAVLFLCLLLVWLVFLCCRNVYFCVCDPSIQAQLQRTHQHFFVQQIRVGQQKQQVLLPENLLILSHQNPPDKAAGVRKIPALSGHTNTMVRCPPAMLICSDLAEPSCTPAQGLGDQNQSNTPRPPDIIHKQSMLLLSGTC